MAEINVWIAMNEASHYEVGPEKARCQTPLNTNIHGNKSSIT